MSASIRAVRIPAPSGGRNASSGAGPGRQLPAAVTPAAPWSLLGRSLLATAPSRSARVSAVGTETPPPTPEEQLLEENRAYKTWLPPFKTRETYFEQVAENVWTLTQDLPLGFLGNPAIRSVLIRLKNGKLWYLAPVAPTVEMQEMLATVGAPDYIVCPSTAPEHSLFVGDVAKLFPSAEVWVPEFMEKRVGDAKIAGVLGGDAPEAWAGEIDQAPLTWNASFNEVLFCHRESKVLMAQDVCFAATGEKFRPDNWIGEQAAKAIGIYDTLGAPAVKAVFKKIPEEGKAWKAKVMAWDFDIFVGGHLGSPVPDAKPQFEACFKFVDDL